MMNYKEITQAEWDKLSHDYKGIIGPNSPTGWPEGTKAMMVNDPQCGTCLVPVKIKKMKVIMRCRVCDAEIVTADDRESYRGTGMCDECYWQDDEERRIDAGERAMGRMDD